jgi:hypothetical protein
MNRKSIILAATACVVLTSSAIAQGGGGGAGGASATSGGTNQTTTPGGTNQSTSAPPVNNTSPGMTTGTNDTHSHAPAGSPAARQAERNKGAGTASNGLPIGAASSGSSEPEHPNNSGNR